MAVIALGLLERQRAVLFELQSRNPTESWLQVDAPLRLHRRHYGIMQVATLVIMTKLAVA